MKILPIRTRNQYWAQCGHNVMELIEVIENKRFQGNPDGDIDYGKLLFNMSGMIREIERLQIENNNIKTEMEMFKKEGCGTGCNCKVDPAPPIKEEQEQPADVITD